MLSEADTNKDGFIDLKEFKATMAEMLEKEKTVRPSYFEKRPL